MWQMKRGMAIYLTWLVTLLWSWQNEELSVDAFSYSSLMPHHQSSKKMPLLKRALISPSPRRTVTRHMSTANSNDSTSLKRKSSKKRSNKARKSKKKGNFSKKLGQAKAINKELINASSAQELLDLFISKGGAKGSAGGDVFNSVNFSTCLHRLARFANQNDNYNNKRNQKGNYQNKNANQKKNLSVNEKRKLVLSDPRTAILFASMSEAIVQPKSNNALVFNNRELANLGWAIAKLKVAPPSNIYPIVRPSDLVKKSEENHSEHNGSPDIISSTLLDMEEDILLTATKVRAQVLEVAKERSTMKSAAERAAVKNKWIPTLSQLAGKLLDIIAMQVLEIIDDFNSQELANLLYAFANAGRADHILFDKLSAQLVESMEDKSKLFVEDYRKRPKPQEFSNSVWAFASAGLRGQAQINLISGVADTMEFNNGAIISEFKPQELSNTAWGVATLLGKRSSESASNNDIEDDAALKILRRVSLALQERVDDFKSQEVSNSIWAFATVGFGAAPTSVQFNTNNDNLCLKSDRTAEDRALVAQTLNIVAESALKRLHRFRPQELNNLAWGFCRLGHDVDLMDELFHGIGQELLKRHHFFKPQDIGTTLWSFATVEYFDEAVYQAAASELTLRRSRSFKPQELSNTVWALATAGAKPRYGNAFDTTVIPQARRASLSQVTSDPITECFAAATTELMRRPHHFKAQEIKDVLWSLSRAGIRHPGVFKSVAEHLVGSNEDVLNGKTGRGMNDFSPQGLGNIAWAYAKQAQLEADVNESIIGSTGRLAIYETSCLDVGEDLIHRLFVEIAETSARSLNRFKPQDLSNTCWAFATLGLLHKKFFLAVTDQVRERLLPSQAKGVPTVVKFKAQEIANLVWSFATLNCKANGMIECFAPCLVQMCSKGRESYNEESIARCIKRQEAASLAWSCAVLEEYPATLMPLLYTALFGKDSNGNPKHLNVLYGDGGIQKQAIMTMFYVQMALQLEASELNLSLPTNFPDGWDQSDDNVQRKHASSDEIDTSMLQLTTSKLQQRISHTLRGIGFDHMLEHTITTDQIEADYGIRLSSENQEFLSLDIANLEDFIGVEVDGPGHFVNVLDGNEADVSTFDGKAMKTGKGKTGWEFTANHQQQENGPTALKHRLMTQMGWSIGHIPYFEWREQDDEVEYCRKLMNDL